MVGNTMWSKNTCRPRAASAKCTGDNKTRKTEREREREKERGKESERESKRERELGRERV